MSSNESLPHVRAGLLRHPLDDQVLVYDSSREQVHLLDRTSAAILELLEEGGWTWEGIAIELAERVGVEANVGLLPLAIEELRRAGILDETSESVEALPEVTRREAIRGFALTGAAAVLLPTIATLTATAGYAQGSPPPPQLLAACQPCTQDSQCTSGSCIDGNAAPDYGGGLRCSGGVAPTLGRTGFTGNPTFGGFPTTESCSHGSHQATANAYCCAQSATITGCGPWVTVPSLNVVAFICN